VPAGWNHAIINLEAVVGMAYEVGDSCHTLRTPCTMQYIILIHCAHRAPCCTHSLHTLIYNARWVTAAPLSGLKRTCSDDTLGGVAMGMTMGTRTLYL
jgi:hypothetical protein